ncbi:MAG TPA: LysM peptidoglycan-binding domain-containing protein [Egicoccus sp.]|nr:LysM peptidoglycan-binding domain-containing protein [Egicoccus sp.]HSK21532.1 LysM peptidoglycan-binding domain-containing protein [Egicoccus sp.]
MAGSDQKAYLETETGTRLPCLFNPEQLSISLSTEWTGENLPGKQTPTLRYGGGKSGSISVELLFDTTADGSPVTTYTDKLIKLLKVDTSLPGYDETKQNGRPPWVKFHWGKFHSFKSVVTSLDLSYVYFSAAGEPLRARAQLSLEQFEQEDDWPRQNPTSGTPLPSRSHQMQPGETLDRVAAKYYDDPTAWRHLAEANGIRDPFALRPGVRVDVPTLEV